MLDTSEPLLSICRIDRNHQDSYSILNLTGEYLQREKEEPSLLQSQRFCVSLNRVLCLVWYVVQSAKVYFACVAMHTFHKWLTLNLIVPCEP